MSEESKLFVGNFPFETTENELTDKFKEFGEISEVKIITDRDSGRSRGFGFVTMQNAEDARAALDGEDFNGRPLRVDNAKDKPRPQGGGGNGGNGGQKPHFRRGQGNR